MIWLSYGQYYSALFFLTHSVDMLMERKNRHFGCIFHHYGGTLPFEPWNPNFAYVVGSTT